MDPVYADICQNAVSATGAAVVAMTRVDHATRRVRVVAWAGAHSELVERSSAAVRHVLPDFDPIKVEVSIEHSDMTRRGYAEAESFSTKLSTIARGIVPSVVLDVAGRIVGIRAYHHFPLIVDGRAEGALIFLTPGELTEPQRRTSGAFVRQVALMLENARLLDEARRARSELEAVFEATEDSVVVFAADGRLLRANARARTRMAELFNAEVGDLAHVRAHVEPAADHPLPTLVADALKGQPADAMMELRAHDGALRQLHAHAAPIKDAAGAAVGVVVVTRDITDLHQALTERARLDGAVKTARLVAHQLNNKLGSTLGYGMLLREAPGGPSAARYAQAVIQSAEEAAEIVRQLQQLTRFEEVATPLGVPMRDLEASTTL